MDTAPVLALLFAPWVVAVSLLGPGLWLVRRTAWDPIEKVTATAIVSILAVGLFSFGVAVLHLHPLLRPVAALACAALALWQAPAVLRALRRDEVRRDLLAFLALLLWLGALQAMARVYSNGNGLNDWLEHFERAWFFLGHQPTTQLFTGFPLTARPPLMGAFSAQVLAVTGGRFAVYEWTALVVASLAYFPSLQLARFFGSSRRTPWILAALLGSSPLFVHSATYPWTKMQAAFLTVAALAFYAAGVRRADGTRILFAFVAAAAGILLHYSVVTAALFLAGHFVLFVLPRRPNPVREIVLIAAAAALILLPWFLWSSLEFGAGEVAGAPLASTGWTPGGVGASVLKFLLNLRDSLVPPLIRGVSTDARIDRLNWGALRDTASYFYIRNLVFAFGSAGAAVLLWSAWSSRRAARGRTGPAPIGPSFWIGLAISNALVNLALHGGRDRFGLAHLTQQPILLVALAYIAARLEFWPRAARALVAAGAILDTFLGILLNAWMQMYTTDVPADWKGPLGLSAGDLAIGSGQWNLMQKEGGHHRFVADLLPGVDFLAWPLVALLFAAGVLLLVRVAAGAGARGAEQGKAHL